MPHTVPFVVLSSEIDTLAASFSIITSNGVRNVAMQMHRITTSPWRFRRLRLFSIPFTYRMLLMEQPTRTSRSTWRPRFLSSGPLTDTLA